MGPELPPSRVGTAVALSEAMKLPVQITFRDMDPSPAIESAVRERVEELERVFDRVTSCRVMIESPHHHQRKGRLFHVRIDLTVPGDELVIGRNPGEHLG